MYMVVVTYGTRMHQPYASGIPNRRDAEALRHCAVSRGYLDARIESEADFRAAQEASRASAARARQAA